MTNGDARNVRAVADRLRLTRLAMGYKVQAAWARVVGISPAAWNNYEQGLRLINVPDAGKVASVTGVTLDWIYHGSRRGLPSEFLQRLVEIERAETAAAGEPLDRGKARNPSKSG